MQDEDADLPSPPTTKVQPFTRSAGRELNVDYFINIHYATFLPE
jgi:hypothetical protein